MLKGIAAAASAMLPRIRAQEVIANNLANASTAGFKRDRVFDVDLSGAQAVLAQTQPQWQTSQTSGISTDFSAGPLERTDNPLNVAVDGDGFFVVSTPDGERYTRNGILQIASDGTLVTVDGHPLQGWAGAVQVTGGTLTIADDGMVSVDGLDVGQLRLVRFRDPSALVHAASSLFAAADPMMPPEDDYESLVRQGYLEQSNVNTIEELVDMIATMRIYETDQKSIQIQDDTLGRAVSDLGRVR
ncbi:MAG TPA: flagellar basal-body rod protein FlgF [Acidobacteriota bacterium]|nr:flagellar basal-body rod protein FlgF [Acidobacteriota bacterium]